MDSKGKKVTIHCPGLFCLSRWVERPVNMLPPPWELPLGTPRGIPWGPFGLWVPWAPRVPWAPCVPWVPWITWVPGPTKIDCCKQKKTCFFKCIFGRF